jgi:isoquinoline 1-oxidoreductase alpha subunit
VIFRFEVYEADLDSLLGLVYFDFLFRTSIARQTAYPTNQQTEPGGVVMATLRVNGQARDIGDLDPSTPLLWVLRDELGLLGTKYGCGIAQCGACTVHMNGAPVRSCQIPVGNLTNEEITTIEGLAAADGTLTALQSAWIEHDVPQCGYCQAGQLMSATALLRNNPNPSDAEIDAAMSGNLCRCATYTRIRRAIKSAAGTTATAFYDAAAQGERA